MNATLPKEAIANVEQIRGLVHEGNVLRATVSKLLDALEMALYQLKLIDNNRCRIESDFIYSIRAGSRHKSGQERLMKIAILKHAYQPDLQGMEQPRIKDDDYTMEEAVAQIEEWNAEVYVTDHNESGRPTYVIIKDIDADYIEGGRNDDMSNYDWSACSCTRYAGECCGECNECSELMISQDREYLISRGYQRSGQLG